MDFSAPTFNADRFGSGEILADQEGAGDVLTFTFTQQQHLVWVRSDGGNVRVDPFGGTPTATLGILVEDAVPQAIGITTLSVKVYASAFTTVRVWGARYLGT